MSKYVILVLLLLSISGCNLVKPINSLVGSPERNIHTARCSKSAQDCYQEASKVCGGSYQIHDDGSHPDGLVADAAHSPVTWYSMNYICEQE